MKKTLALMMAAVLLLSLLCACGGEDKAKGSEGEWKDPALPDYVMIVGDGQARVEDAEGNQVSAGTYTVQEDQITFVMDNGTFTGTLRGDEMVFEKDGVTTVYERQ